MRPLSKIGLVAFGYVASILLASAVVAIRVLMTSGPDAQASSGMYAFGDALLFVTVLGVAGLVPTGLALFFLRPYPRFWTVFAALVVAVAITGVVAAAVFAVGRSAVSGPLAEWTAFSVLRILVAPLLTLAFLAFTVLSPYRVPRLVFLAATAAEAAVSAYGAFVWVLPLLLHTA